MGDKPKCYACDKLHFYVPGKGEKVCRTCPRYTGMLCSLHYTRCYLCHEIMCTHQCKRQHPLKPEKDICYQCEEIWPNKKRTNQILQA